MIKKLGKQFRSRVQTMSEKQAGSTVVVVLCSMVVVTGIHFV